MSCCVCIYGFCALKLWLFCFPRVTVRETSTKRNTAISGGGAKCIRDNVVGFSVLTRTSGKPSPDGGAWCED